MHICSSNRRSQYEQLHANSDTESNASSNDSRQIRRKRHDPKLPPFTGKESWQVWYNRFNDMARRYKWTDDEKLDNLLPKLQGVAGDFVYGQLTYSVRSNPSQIGGVLIPQFQPSKLARLRLLSWQFIS